MKDAAFWTLVNTTVADKRALLSIYEMLRDVDVSQFQASSKLSGPHAVPDPLSYHNQMLAGESSEPIVDFVMSSAWKWTKGVKSSVILPVFTQWLLSTGAFVSTELQGAVGPQRFGETVLSRGVRAGVLLKQSSTGAYVKVIQELEEGGAGGAGGGGGAAARKKPVLRVAPSLRPPGGEGAGAGAGASGGAAAMLAVREALKRKRAVSEDFEQMQADYEAELAAFEEHRQQEYDQDRQAAFEAGGR